MAKENWYLSWQTYSLVRWSKAQEACNCILPHKIASICTLNIGLGLVVRLILVLALLLFFNLVYGLGLCAILSGYNLALHTLYILITLYLS